jgi:transposase
MLKVDVEKWGQSAEHLRQLALDAEHSRSRERLMALYEICSGQNASQIGRASQRNPQTVMGWVHRYNEQGPEAMLYRRTGGHPPLFPTTSSKP